VLQEIDSGLDPTVEKARKVREAEQAKHHAEANSVATAIERFLAEYVSTLRRSTRVHWTSALRRYFIPECGSILLADFNDEDVTAVLALVMTEGGHDGKGSKAMARSLFGILKSFQKWCFDPYKHKGGKKLISKPFMYMLKEPAKANKRERVLSDQEIRAMWHAAGEIGYPYSAATKMLLLTGQRRTEVSAMPIAEVDRKARLWSMPDLPFGLTLIRASGIVRLRYPVKPLSNRAPNVTQLSAGPDTGRRTGHLSSARAL
jgi:integrase